MVKMKDVKSFVNSFFMVKIPTPLVREKKGGIKMKDTHKKCVKDCK